MYHILLKQNNRMLYKDKMQGQGDGSVAKGLTMSPDLQNPHRYHVWQPSYNLSLEKQKQNSQSKLPKQDWMTGSGLTGTLSW